MKNLCVAVAGVCFLLGASGAFAQAPAPVMYTLDQIYYYLAEGTESDWGDYDLEPPAGAEPGEDFSGNTKSLADIYYFMADAFGQADAVVDDVAEGKVFFSTRRENWGVQTGTASAGGGVLRTGQTDSYHIGDDGYYQKGARFSYQTADPAGNGEIVTIDNVTGLVWASDGNEAGCYNGEQLNWTQAIDWAEGLSFAGQTDWRLPNSTEIMTLMVMDANKRFGFVNLTYFPNTVMGVYWSSTSNPYDTTRALGPYYYWGYQVDVNKTHNYNVRAVRGGE